MSNNSAPPLMGVRQGNPDFWLRQEAATTTRRQTTMKRRVKNEKPAQQYQHKPKITAAQTPAFHTRQNQTTPAQFSAGRTTYPSIHLRRRREPAHRRRAHGGTGREPPRHSNLQ